MEELKNHCYSIAREKTRKVTKLSIFGLILSATFLILTMTVLKPNSLEDYIFNRNIFLIFTLIFIIMLTFTYPIILLCTKNAIEKLPENIEKIWKERKTYNNIKQFVFCNDGIIVFSESLPIYIKYYDIDMIYDQGFTDFEYLIPGKLYFINIRTYYKTYHIKVILEFNGQRYKAKDFRKIIEEIYIRNNRIELIL